MREETHGAFGGAFGGLVAALILRQARAVAPGRTPLSLDVNFLRGVPAGDVRVEAAVVHSGRSLTCVTADVVAGEKLLTRATVKLGDPAALGEGAIDGESDAKPPAPAYGSGRLWGENAEAIPMIASMQPRTMTGDDRGVGFALEVPWDSTGADAEAACFAADGAVGPCVAFAARGRFSHPNPDLSMRFVPDGTAGAEVVGFGRVERGHGGAAVVAVEVWSGPALIAIGLSTSLLLPL